MATPLRQHVAVRGSIALALHYDGGRTPHDLDLVALVPWGDARVEHFFTSLIGTHARGSVQIAHDRATAREVIWEETTHPGWRTSYDVIVDGAASQVQVDMAFGDTLALPPGPLGAAYPGVLVAQPEELFAWKLHGIIEFGLGQWRPKDPLRFALAGHTRSASRRSAAPGHRSGVLEPRPLHDRIGSTHDEPSVGSKSERSAAPRPVRARFTRNRVPRSERHDARRRGVRALASRRAKHVTRTRVASRPRRV